MFRGLLECENNGGADIVLIHDGARPFIEPDTIQQTIEN